MDVKLDSFTGIPKDTYNYLNDFSVNPVVLVVISIVLILYYVLFASLGVATGNTQGIQEAGKSVIFLEILLWSVFIVLLLLNGIYYFFEINVVASIKNLFTATPEISFKVETGKEILPELKYVKQTFHIPGNKYTYEDAKAVCKAYGSKLASYKDLEKSYEQGAEWCSYGWSEGQMAYFPTQYEKWKELQKIKGHEHDCGRPGINGGYIANPNVRFGVNCYGYKPKISPLDYDLMNNTTVYPKTQDEIDFDREVDKWRQKIPEIAVAPFNNNRWSVI
jgi:hypothetical protein